ncbi:MAG: hypothetical protein ACMG6E_08340 [Candidatus Roizmanbacteria bacterium]
MVKLGLMLHVLVLMPSGPEGISIDKVIMDGVAHEVRDWLMSGPGGGGLLFVLLWVFQVDGAEEA